MGPRHRYGHGLRGPEPGYARPDDADQHARTFILFNRIGQAAQAYTEPCLTEPDASPSLCTPSAEGSWHAKRHLYGVFLSVVLMGS